MGSCLSKKTTICSSPIALPVPDQPPDQTKTNPQVAEKKKAEEEETVKKEIFLIKHRKSHDTDRRSEEEKAESDQKVTTSCESADVGSNTTSASNGGLPNGGVVVVRTSSCTKEEVDAILIQCGRLSRSSSTGKPAAALSGSGQDDRGRKYSGSKRSYDFDHETSNEKCNAIEDGNYNEDVTGDGETVADRIHRYRQRQRQSRPSSLSGRRRTPSREREQQQPQRSGSRERGSGSGGGRRVSRSPGRRSESPTPGAISSSSANTNGSNTYNGSGRPGKMVSVPATVSSLVMDKSNNGGGAAEPPSAAAIKRISVKRNAGDGSSVGCRAGASPRSRSPYRRNPLGEIDQNCVGFEAPHLGNKATNIILSQASTQKPNVENVKSKKGTVQGSDSNTNGGKEGILDNKAGTCRVKEQQPVEDESKELPPMTSNVAVTVVVASGGESLKPQTITRSRSSRLSRDLDLNPETPPLNPSPSSYTALLLEDIQNFHQMNAPAISLPPCVTKACSILEAVADLNSSTRSNKSGTVPDDRRRNPTAEQFSKNDDSFSFGAGPGKKRLESKKDPFVESEVLVNNDLTEPSFHKYVTVSRGAAGGVDMEEQESSGSNSFVGGHQNWVSSSSWEPNSADSTDCWTSSRLNTKGEDGSPLGFQRHSFSG